MKRTFLLYILLATPVLLPAQANRNLLNYFQAMDAGYLFWTTEETEPLAKQDRLDLLTEQKPSYLKGALPGNQEGYAQAFFEVKYFRDSDGYEILVLLQNRCKTAEGPCEQQQYIILPGSKPGGGGVEFWDVSGTIFRHFPTEEELRAQKAALSTQNSCMGEAPDASFFIKISPDHDLLFLSAPECYPAQQFELFQFKFQIHQFWIVKR
ncbi:MAG: hypothetical protein KF690_02075 [Bacteroidetes bacterium]|nr:hypothetical protein [Bacteroidota bacterium]